MSRNILAIAYLLTACQGTEPPLNTAPEVLRPIDISHPIPLRATGGRVVLIVVAEDDEDDELTFVWDYPTRSETPNIDTFESKGDWISTLTMNSTDTLNGDDIFCTVTDPQGESVQVNWELAVE